MNLDKFFKELNEWAKVFKKGSCNWDLEEVPDEFQNIPISEENNNESL